MTFRKASRRWLRNTLHGGRISPIDKPLLGQVVGLLRVSALDASAARALALHELRITLDVINFFTDLVMAQGEHAYTFLPGDMESGKLHYMVAKEGRGAFSGVDSRGPFVRCSLTNLRGWETVFYRPSVFYVGLSGVEHVLRTSSIRSAVVRPSDGRPSSGRSVPSLPYFARVSHLRYSAIKRGTARHPLHASPGPEEKQGKIKDVKRLYRVRGAIVHSGRTQITDQDLALARAYSKSAILTVLKGRRIRPTPKTSSDLDQWFRNRDMAS